MIILHWLKHCEKLRVLNEFAPAVFVVHVLFTML